MNPMLLLKASLVLSVALVAARLLRRAPAAVRHTLFSATFTALLVLPILAFSLPALYVPLPQGWTQSLTGSFRLPWSAPASRSAEAESSGLQEARNGGSAAARTSPLRHERAEDPARHTSPSGAFGLPWSERAPASRRQADDPAWTVLLAVWLIGSIAAAGALGLSLVRARRLTRTAVPLDDPLWRDAARTLCARLGLRHPPRLLVSPSVRTPMASGLWRAVVFLPASAAAWSAERRDIVLAHELAHLAGRDPLRHFAARLAVALYWFHPLAVLAAGESSIAREQACDETVLALGTRPSAYAQVLLDLAESLQGPLPAVAALPMVERSLLERRVMAILNHEIRSSARGRAIVPAIALALVTVIVAASQPLVRASDAANTYGRHEAPNGVAERAAIASAPTAPTVALPAVSPQSRVRDSACSWEMADGSSFSGSISTSRVGGRTVVNEQIGTRGADRIIQQRLADLRLCLVAEGVDPSDPSRPSEWLGRARRVVMESRRGNVTQQLDLDREAGGAQRVTWRVGGSERPFDAAAQQWRDRMLAALDTTWELSSLRGNVSSLRGDISSIRGEESSLRGEISSLHGEVSSMRGHASSVRGDESSLRGQISSIEGHVSSLRGAISSEQGAISSLTANRYDAGAAERGRIADSVSKHDAEIARLEREIRDYNADAKIAAMEKQIRALDADGKVAAIDAEIHAFDLDGKVAAIDRQIAALGVEGKIGAIEKQIAALDADRRGRQLEDRRDEEIKQLEAAIAAIK